MITATLLTTAIAFGSPAWALADDRADSVALIGAWRWERSAGGLAGAIETPPLTGWSRVLYLHRDGSVAEYLLCNGKYTVHQSRETVGSAVSLWVELEGWSFDVLPRERITFMSRDSIQMYPGGGGTWVDDALTHTYVRETTQQEPRLSGRAASPVARRPPRLRTGLPQTYFADLEPQMLELRARVAPFFEWMDWQYPASVRKDYSYAQHQIPSAVIGDFDGDGSMDVAIHGSTGYVESKVLCLLSNHGHPKSLFLLSEPTFLDEPNAPAANRFREPHPTLFLKLLPRGQAIQDSLGNPLTLPNDAILVVRPKGYGTPYYYADGEFRKAKARPEQPWDPRGTRE